MFIELIFHNMFHIGQLDDCFHENKIYDISFWANNWYNADQIFAHSTLWSGLYKVPFSVVRLPYYKRHGLKNSFVLNEKG